MQIFRNLGKSYTLKGLSSNAQLIICTICKATNRSCASQPIGTPYKSYTLKGLSAVPFTQCLEIVDFLAKGYKGKAQLIICKKLVWQ